MIVTLHWPAPEGARFALDAFESAIGTSVPLRTPHGGTEAVLRAARVADDGTSVELDIEPTTMFPPPDLTRGAVIDYRRYPAG